MTLTDIIAKITLFAKRAIVNDNSSNAAVSINQTGSGTGLSVASTTGTAVSITGTTGTGASITTTTGTALRLQQNNTNPQQGGTLEFFKSGGGDMVFDGANDGVFTFSNTSAASTKAIIFDGAPVGILTAPKATLHVSGDIANEFNNYYSGNIYFEAGNWKYINNGVGGAIKLADASGAITFATAPNNTFGSGATASLSVVAAIKPTGTVSLYNLSTFSNNAAAITGGLVANDVYKTVTGELRIVV